MYLLEKSRLNNSPRAVKLWECCLATFYENLSRYKTKVRQSTNREAKADLTRLRWLNGISFDYVNQAFDYYLAANKNHRPRYEFNGKNTIRDSVVIDTFVPVDQDNPKTKLVQQEIIVASGRTLLKPKIAVANTKVNEENIKKSLLGEPNLSGDRFNTLYKIFRQTREEKADILLLPECFIPIELLDRLTWFAVNEQKLVITGVEHVSLGGVALNFIVTILPFEREGVKDAIVSYRLKNHYSHAEALMIQTNHLKVPKSKYNIYQLFVWRGIYFSPYYCFELADVKHRSLFKSKIDLLVACEWNPDINYFSSIVESISRDLHCYVAQVNTSQYGDTRITQPSKTEMKDILKLKGGENDTILTGELDVGRLRSFQRELYLTTRDDKTFKPLPPDFQVADVLKRINREPILKRK